MGRERHATNGGPATPDSEYSPPADKWTKHERTPLVLRSRLANEEARNPAPKLISHGQRCLPTDSFAPVPICEFSRYDVLAFIPVSGRTMPQFYDRSGLRFMYPDTWAIEESLQPSEVTVHVQSPNTAFVVFVLFEEPRDSRALVDQVVETMAEEYSDIDAEDVEQQVGGHPANGSDLNFISFDLTNTCRVRAFQAAGRSVLVVAQSSDLDLDAAEPAFQGIFASLCVSRAKSKAGHAEKG